MLKFIRSICRSIKISTTNSNTKRAAPKGDPESGERNEVRCGGTHDRLSPSSSRT